MTQVSSIDQSLQNLLDRKIKHSFPGKVGGVSLKTKWTDEHLKEMITDLKYDNRIQSKSDYGVRLLEFWRCYLIGDLTEGIPFASLLAEIILFSPTPDSLKNIKLIFDLKLNGKVKLIEPYDLKPVASYENLVIGEMVEPIIKESDVTRLREAEETEVTVVGQNIQIPKIVKKEAEFSSVSERDKDRFLFYINTNLQSLLKGTSFSDTDIEFIKLSSAVAMICLRALVKDTIVMSNAFCRKKLPTNLKNLLKLSGDLLIIPPCKKFIEILTIRLAKNNACPVSLISIIVYIYTLNRKREDTESKNTIALLMYTCLMSTALNGLNIIKLFGEVRLTFGLQPLDLMPYFFLDSNKSMWVAILAFLDETCEANKEQISAYWCRLIDDSYYSNIKITLVAPIAVWLAAILENLEKHRGIWDSVWAKNVLPLNYFAKSMGNRYYAYLTSMRKEEGYTAQMKEYCNIRTNIPTLTPAQNTNDNDLVFQFPDEHEEDMD